MRPPLRRTLTALAAVAFLAPLVGSASAQVPDPARAAPAPLAAKKFKPGLDGAPILIEDNVVFSGFDMDTDPGSGTAYLGWISAQPGSPLIRSVHLCVLPPGATGCAGGVLTTNSPGDPASAAGIKVVVDSNGTVTLVWYYDAPGTGYLAQAVYANGALGPMATVATAPDNGALADVVYSPEYVLYSLVRNASTAGPQGLQLRSGLTTPIADLVAPWPVGRASIGLGRVTGIDFEKVVIASRAGAISEPVHVWSNLDASPALAPVARTWTVGGVEDLVRTKDGLRLIAAEDNAGYRPVVSRWGPPFGKPRLTGDKNSCAPATHDLVTDRSGRGADVANECGQLTISNLADTENAGLARFAAGGTISSGPPQITTTQRGFGWVAWGVLSPTGNRLLVAPIRLPALIIDKSDNSNGGKVTVEGPADCLPVVTAKAKVRANPKPGWRLLSKTLVLDGRDVGRSTQIHGARARSGKRFELVGKAVFARGRDRATASQKLKFTAC